LGSSVFLQNGCFETNVVRYYSCSASADRSELCGRNL